MRATDTTHEGTNEGIGDMEYLHELLAILKAKEVDAYATAELRQKVSQTDRSAVRWFGKAAGLKIARREVEQMLDREALRNGVMQHFAT